MSTVAAAFAQAGLTAAALVLLVLAGWLADALFGRTSAHQREDGARMMLETEARQRATDRLREAEQWRAQHAGSPRRERGSVRRAIGHGLIRTGLRVLPTLDAAGEGAR